MHSNSDYSHKQYNQITGSVSQCSHWRRDNALCWKRDHRIVCPSGKPQFLCDRTKPVTKFHLVSSISPVPNIFRALPPLANLRQLRSRQCEWDGHLLLLRSLSRTTLLCFGNDIKASCERGARILPECYRGTRRIAFRCGGRWFVILSACERLS